MRPAGRLLTAVVSGSLALLLLGSAVGLAADPAAIDLKASQAKDGRWQLKALVLDTEGAPLTGTAVRFSVAVDFLGDRRVFLGSATTDVTGRATLVYRPTWNGQQRLIAEAGGAEGGPVAAGQLTIAVEGVQAPIAPDPVALPLMRTWAVPVAGLVVATVWAVLIGVFLVAVIGIRRARSGARQAVETSVQEPAQRPVGADATAGDG